MSRHAGIHDKIKQSHRRGRGRRAEPPAVSASDVSAWFAGQLPDDWFSEPPTVTIDRDEILVVGRVAAPKIAKGDDPAVAAAARISAFREDTREHRIAVAQRAQDAFSRTVSWGVSCGDESTVFTRANVPVMTRLDMPERHVLDTLIDAGIARSRSEALAWCVRLVGEQEAGWIDELRTAMHDVERLRNDGPASTRQSS